MAATAYLTIGLFLLPVFHGGGNIEYIYNPSFGFLLGFIPAAWITGQLSMQDEANSFLYLTLSSIAGLSIIQFCGVVNLYIGHLINSWTETLPEILFSYSVAPLPAQLALCPTVAIIALILRRLLFIE